MNQNVYNIIASYANKPNDKETRASLVRELGAELLKSAPTFKGHLVDTTSLVDEAMGRIDLKISYMDKLYSISEFKTLAGID